MLKTLIIFLKSLGVLVVSLLVVFFSTNNDLVLHFGSAILVLLASALFFFAKTIAIRAQAFLFLLLAIAISHAVDRYFWGGVWELGYPWPYSNGIDKTAGFMGSISSFMDQVATVCFSVLGGFATIAVACHLKRRSKSKSTASQGTD